MTRDVPYPSIHKFGGAALADADAVRHAASIVADRAPAPIVVVASALAGVTDALLAIAARAAAGDAAVARADAQRLRDRHLEIAAALLDDVALAPVRRDIEESFAELGSLVAAVLATRELTPRTSDNIVARGERLSARILAATLVARGVPAQLIDATEIVRTDGRFGGGAPDIGRTEQAAAGALRALVEKGCVPVVPGFIGSGPDAAVVTLGRGGSDLTATLLARALGAREVFLWKDVPGILTADPRVVPDARVVPQLSVREAAELAYYGAKVLHPRALIPLTDNTRVYVRPFADPDGAGTEVSTRTVLSGSPVKAITAIMDQALVTVSGNGMLGVAGIAERTFAAVHRANVSVSFISQASSEHSICLAVPDATAPTAGACLREAFAAELVRGEIDDIEVQQGLATIAVVGLGMAHTPGVAARVFGALAEAGVNVVAIAQGSSELNISIIIDAGRAADAQRAIHAAFGLGDG